MASLIDRIHSAMSELSQRSWDDDSLICTKMKDFEDEIDFLARFVDCIRCRSNALELAAHLGSVATKAEASVQKIGGEFLDEMNRDKWGFVISVVSFNLVGSSEKKASEWIDVFDKWVSMIFALKPDVANALDSLSINSVQCKISVHDFPRWERFVISTYKHVQDVQAYFSAHYRRPDRRIDVRFVASYLERLIGNLENDHTKDPKIEAFLTKLGSSIISAELLCFQWWSSNYNTQRKENISAAFRDLEQMIELTNPEFVDVILRILKNSERFSTIADLVVPRYIPFTAPYFEHKKETIMFYTLGRELISLITWVLQMLEEENVMAEKLLSDTKQLLMETASLRHSFYEVKDESVARKLLEKISLIKIEIILRIQITTSSSILEENMKRYVYVIKESSDGSTADTDILNRILMLMEEVAREANPMHGKSAPVVVRSLLIKTLLLTGSFKNSVESLHDKFEVMMPFL